MSTSPLQTSLTEPLSQADIASIREHRRVSVVMARGSSFGRIAEVPDLQQSVQTLEVQASKSSDVRGLEELRSLEVLYARGLQLPPNMPLDSLREYSGGYQSQVFAAPNLTHLHIVGTLRDAIQPLQIEGPVEDVFFDTKDLRFVPVLAYPASLRSARFWGAQELDLAELREAKNLELFWLEKTTRVISFDAVARHPRLSSFRMLDVRNLSPLVALSDSVIPYGSVEGVHPLPPALRAEMESRGWDVVGGDRLFSGDGR